MAAPRIRITVLSPVLAGSGEQLSPIDYMVWQNEVRVLDQERIFKLLARNPRLESYLDQLRRGDRLDWAQWGGYAQSYSSARIPFASGGLSQIWEKARNEDLYIPLFARGGAWRILPGSSLKGAFRTAWMFGSLDEAKKAAVWKECSESGSRGASVASLESASHARKQLEDLGFTDLKLGPEAFRIYQTRTLVLRTPDGPKGLPAEWKPGQQFAEMLKPGTVVEGRGHFPAAASEAVRVQARRWLEQHAAFAKQATLRPLIENVDRLRAEESKLPEGACLLPLGWGTGFTAKALSPDLTTPEARMRFAALAGLRRGMATNLPFPKTRRVVLDGAGSAALCGWVKVEPA